MPSKYIAKLARKKNISVEKSEKLWNQSKSIASENGHADEFDYITGVFKKMMGESLTFKEFLLLIEESEPTNTSGGTMPDHEPTDGRPKMEKVSIFVNIKGNKNVVLDNDTDLDDVTDSESETEFEDEEEDEFEDEGEFK